MKREYVAMIFMSISVAVLLSGYYFFTEEIVELYLTRFIIIWLFIAFYAGQYSMKFPKRF